MSCWFWAAIILFALATLLGGGGYWYLRIANAHNLAAGLVVIGAWGVAAILVVAALICAIVGVVKAW